jgi:hypothetical protein
MRNRTSRTTTDRSSVTPEVTFDGCPVFGFKDGEGNTQELTPWNHDDVEARRDATAAKNLSN